MKKTILSLSSAIVFAVALFITSKNEGLITTFYSSHFKPQFAINFSPAKTTNELNDIRTNTSLNVIKTKKDVDFIFTSFRSPLSLLSKEDLSEFKSKLVERNGVIVSMQYADVQKKLNAQDFENLMAMFGFDLKNGYWGVNDSPAIATQLRGSSKLTAVAEDYTGYFCNKPFNCVKLSGYICMSGC